MLSRRVMNVVDRGSAPCTPLTRWQGPTNRWGLVNNTFIYSSKLPYIYMIIYWYTPLYIYTSAYSYISPIYGQVYINTCTTILYIYLYIGTIEEYDHYLMMRWATRTLYKNKASVWHSSVVILHQRLQHYCIAETYWAVMTDWLSLVRCLKRNT